jgi:hypothetical protein
MGTDLDLTSVIWHKSSYSAGSHGNCVEVGHWRKSSRSGSSGGNCFEVADGVPGLIPVRDSKNPHGPALAFAVPAWSAFVTGVKRGALTEE